MAISLTCCSTRLRSKSFHVPCVYSAGRNLESVLFTRTATSQLQIAGNDDGPSSSGGRWTHLRGSWQTRLPARSWQWRDSMRGHLPGTAEIGWSRSPRSQGLLASSKMDYQQSETKLLSCTFASLEQRGSNRRRSAQSYQWKAQ